jgi:hypothetical protein
MIHCILFLLSSYSKVLFFIKNSLIFYVPAKLIPPSAKLN